MNSKLFKFLLGSCVSLACAAASAQSINAALAGTQEVPPVTTAASGKLSIVVAPDGSISGSVTTTGIEGTAAHIHEAALGQNGPVVIPLTKTADNTWSVPAGAKLTEGQLQSFKSGKLYVNVHSAANKSGEIRAQIVP